MILGSTASQVLKINPESIALHCYSTTTALYSSPLGHMDDFMLYSWFDASGTTPTPDIHDE